LVKQGAAEEGVLIDENRQPPCVFQPKYLLSPHKVSARSDVGYEQIY